MARFSSFFHRFHPVGRQYLVANPTGDSQIDSTTG
jgi:hypothetical protein